MSVKILSFMECRNGEIKRSSFETLIKAKAIAEELVGEIKGLVVGNDIKNEAKTVGGYGVDRAIAVSDKRLENYSTTAYAKVIAKVIKEENCDMLFIPATAMGKDLAPYLVPMVNGAVAADCTAVSVKDGDLVATRPVYAGKAMVDVSVKAPVKIFSLRPNVFPVGEKSDKEAAVENMTVELNDDDFRVKIKEIISVSKGKLDVTEADIIVSGGRGLKDPKNFSIIEELADLLGAAVGASRAVVDAGWRPHDEQVGQTGKTVSPSLYIAIGISGAVQHLAGMSSSKYIVAINKDKDAPIFQVADFGIVGDAFEIVPALTEELKKVIN